MENEEKPKEEINSESVLDELRKYLETATQEQLDKDWEELKQYNEFGPEIVETFSYPNECCDIHQPEELQKLDASVKILSE